MAIVGHDVRLKVYSDFTSDKKQLERALNEVDALRPRVLTQAPAGDGPSILRDMRHERHDRATPARSTRRWTCSPTASARSARARTWCSSRPASPTATRQCAAACSSNRSRYLDPALAVAQRRERRPCTASSCSATSTSTPLFHQRLDELAESTGGQLLPLQRQLQARARADREHEQRLLPASPTARRTPRARRDSRRCDVDVKNREFRVIARAGLSVRRL